MDGREHHCALLNQRLRRPDRGVGVDVCNLLLGGRDDPLGGRGEPSQQLEQHCRGRIERHRHGDLADVVYARCAFDLHHLRDVHPLALAADLAALELQHGGGVVDVRRVHQRPEGAGQGSRQATDQVGQADTVPATPRDELEFYNPVQLCLSLVAVFPVAVQANDFPVQLVDHQDVRRRLALGQLVIIQLEPSVDGEHPAGVVFVVLILLAFDLLVGLLRASRLRFQRGAVQADVAVQAAVYPALELPLGDVFHLGDALGGVEVDGRERHQDVVNRDELAARALELVVPVHLDELRAAHRELGQHLLLLVPELLDLVGQLPVHVVALALGDLRLLVVHIAKDVGANRTIGREKLLHRTGCEVYARLGHDRVNYLAGALEVSTAGCVVAQAGATQAVFVLLVALLPGFLVLLKQVEVAQADVIHVAHVHRLGEVLVEVLILSRPLEVIFHRDDSRTVRHLFNAGRLVGQLYLSAAVLVHLDTFDKAVLLWVNRHLSCHVSSSVVCSAGQST